MTKFDPIQMNDIIDPSLICMDQASLASAANRLNLLGISRLHIDVMDGHFVPRLGVPPETVRDYIAAHNRISEIPLKVDAHLMVSDPFAWIPYYAPYANVIFVHGESTNNLLRCAQLCHDLKVSFGVALNPQTSIDLYESIFDEIDAIMLMGINPGVLSQPAWGGLSRKLSNTCDSLDRYGASPEIYIDGGVSFVSCQNLINLGADVLVMGNSTILSPKDTIENNYCRVIDSLTKE